MSTSLLEWIAFIFVSLLTLFFIITIIQLEIEHRRTVRIIKMLDDVGKEVRLQTFRLRQSHDNFINHLK